jgi:hypothetical protein
MSNKDYNYEIEKTLAKYGGEADKGVERTCGNCESYIKEHWACGCADAEDNDFHKATDAGCYYHRTTTEQKLLKNIIDERCRLAEQKRIEDNRRNGTGECAGCPFREMHDMLQKMAKKKDNAPGKLRGQAREQLAELGSTGK